MKVNILDSLRAAAVAALFCISQVAVADEQSAPEPADIAVALDRLIPLYWDIKGVSVKASVNRGDAVEPEWAQRFEALVSVKMSLYHKVMDGVPSGNAAALHPFEELVETVSAESERIIYGVAVSSQSRDVWDIDIKLENNVDKLGAPLDYFNIPTVVRNSPEYFTLNAALSDAAKIAFSAKFTAEMERLRQTHASQIETLKADQRAEISAVERGVADRRAEAKSSSEQWRQEQIAAQNLHKTEMEGLRQTHASQIETLKADQRAEISAVERGVADRRAEAKSSSEQWRQEQIAAQNLHKTEMEGLRQTHASQIETLKAGHKAEIDRIETGLEVEATRLKAETGDFLEIESLTLEKNDAAQKAAAAAAALYAETRDRRKAMIEQIMLDMASDLPAQQRIAAFDAALETQIEFVMAAAFEAALSSDDEAIRLHAISAALASEDADLRRRAMDIALGDQALPELRRAGLARLVASGDAKKIRPFLHEIIATNDPQLLAGVDGMIGNIKPFPFVTGVASYLSGIEEKWDPTGRNERGLYIGKVSITGNDNSASEKAIYSYFDVISKPIRFSVKTHGYPLAMTFKYTYNGGERSQSRRESDYDTMINVYGVGEERRTIKIFSGVARACRREVQHLVVPVPEDVETVIVEHTRTDNTRQYPKNLILFFKMGPDIEYDGKHTYNDDRC